MIQSMKIRQRILKYFFLDSFKIRFFNYKGLTLLFTLSLLMKKWWKTGIS